MESWMSGYSNNGSATCALPSSWYDEDEVDNSADIELLAEKLGEHPLYNHNDAVERVAELYDAYNDEESVLAECKAWLDDKYAQVDLRVRSIIRQMEHHPKYSRDEAYDFAFARRLWVDDSRILDALENELNQKGNNNEEEIAY